MVCWYQTSSDTPIDRARSSQLGTMSGSMVMVTWHLSSGCRRIGTRAGGAGMVVEFGVMSVTSLIPGMVAQNNHATNDFSVDNGGQWWET